jgi:hypothetical protein
LWSRIDGRQYLLCLDLQAPLPRQLLGQCDDLGAQQTTTLAADREDRGAQLMFEAGKGAGVVNLMLLVERNYGFAPQSLAAARLHEFDGASAQVDVTL